MNKEKLFLLLDIDGVLLESHGYRDAYLDSANDFLNRMGQPDLSIDRRIADAFEGNGINAEWDMLPLTIAAFTDWYCVKTGKVPAPGTFPPDCGEVRLTNAEEFRETLLADIAEFASLLDPKYLVMDALYRAYNAGKGNGLKMLWQLPIRERFFINTLSLSNPLFAGLMTRILGSETYTSFYGTEAPLRCPSYLVTRDRRLISDQYRTFLPGIAGKGVFPVVMTYRPTKLPGSGGNQSGSYFVNTPEGECALQVLGWTDGRIPMIGGGSLCYIEEKYGLRREYYVKPHPLHALASMMYGLCGDEVKALEIARGLCELKPGKDPDPASGYLEPGESIRLAVFEDSVTGIRCAVNAAGVLRDWGYSVKTVLCGIRTTEVKNNRLLYAGAVLYPDINAALEKVLK